MILGQVLIVAWLLTLFGLRSRVVALLLGFLTLVPVHGGVSAAMALRGLWGDPSITTLQLLILAWAGKTPSSLRVGWRTPACFALAAAALYASYLGPWNFDLYRLGYQPAALVAFFGVLALVSWWRGQSIYLFLLATDLVAWRTRWLESTNLWDALLDPLLMAAMLALALRNAHGARQNRKALLAGS